MKNLKALIAILLVGSALSFTSCRPDDSKSYGHLEKLNKIYLEMYDAKVNINSLPKNHAGDEEEAYNLTYNELVKQADSIKDLLPAGFKKKADSIYYEVFHD